MTQSVYDALGRLFITIFPDTTSSNVTFYDAAGRVVQSIDALGTKTGYAYDAAGRRTAVTNAFGVSVLQTRRSSSMTP